MIPGGAAADLPDVLQAPELDRAAHPLRHRQGDRDPGSAPPARRAPTVHTTPADDPDRSRPDRRPHPTATGPPTNRHARRTGHDPALAPPARRPPLDHPADPTRPTIYHRRPARHGHPPGHREPHLGDIDASTANSPASATRSAPPPSGPSCTTPASTPRPGEPDHPGPSSCRPKRTRSSPATCSTSTPSPCTGCTRSSSSSTPPAAYTSSASPRIPPAAWLTQQARNLLMDLDDAAPPVPVPHPRPRRQVHRRVRRRLHRHRHPHHQDTGAGAAGQGSRCIVHLVDSLRGDVVFVQVTGW